MLIFSSDIIIFAYINNKEIKRASATTPIHLKFT